MMKIKRPLLRYHGGKFLLAPWIISNFPKHRIYTEVFGGAGSVLLQKKPCYCEVYNDLDEEVVNLFTVVREQGSELIHQITHTPFSRNEFDLSYIKSDNPIEQARRTVIRSFMGFGSASASGKKTGFRSNSNRSGTTPAHDWKNLPDALPAIINRLRGVVIENRNYKEVLYAHDSIETLHYLDPPYVLDTRHKGQNTECYKFEMSDAQHEEMCNVAKSLVGTVIISGYENEIYNGLLTGWIKVFRKAFADGAKERVEVLWINKKNENTQEKLF